jgi:hypothetical protein
MSSKPFADRIRDEVDAFFRLWAERRWLAVVLVVALLGWSALSSIGWYQRGEEIGDLKSAKADLKRDMRLLEAENEGLRETVAPLLKQAAKEFPGEEINASLKKLLARLEAETPYHKPIAAVSTTVEVLIESQEQISTRYMDMGGYVAFGKGTEVLLATTGRECAAKQTGKGEVVYRGIFTMDAADSAMGRPVTFLNEAEYLQLNFKPMPPDSKVLAGNVICVINNSLRFEFVVPPQTTRDNMFFIRDLATFKATLGESDALSEK